MTNPPPVKGKKKKNGKKRKGKEKKATPSLPQFKSQQPGKDKKRGQNMKNLLPSMETTNRNVMPRTKKCGAWRGVGEGYSLS